MKTYVFPGSFDPITVGHLDIINRASNLCDKLIVVALPNASKDHVFSLDERVELIRCAVKENSAVEVDSYDGLFLDYLRQNELNTIIKGIRTYSDYEYEMQMALFYKSRDKAIETIFLMTDPQYSFISSSAIRNLAKSGGKFDDFIPECIRKKVVEKFEKPRCD